jgi:hypothetical protein
MKNRNFAIAIDAPARLVKPKIPAINPTTRKTNAHLNMGKPPSIAAEGTPARAVKFRNPALEPFGPFPC